MRISRKLNIVPLFFKASLRSPRRPIHRGSTRAWAACPSIAGSRPEIPVEVLRGGLRLRRRCEIPSTLARTIAWGLTAVVPDMNLCDITEKPGLDERLGLLERCSRASLVAHLRGHVVFQSQLTNHEPRPDTPTSATPTFSLAR